MERRQLLKRIGSAGLALVLPLPGFSLKPVVTTDKPHTGNGYHRFRLGELDLLSVTDGHILVRPLQPVFAPDIPANLVDGVLEAEFMQTGEIDSGINMLVVKTKDRLILIDTGSGDQLGTQAGHFITNLSAAGIAPDEVTDILITHLHSDHIGGIKHPDGSLRYKNATYHLSQAEYNFWTGATPDFSKRKHPHDDWDEAGIKLAQNVLTAIRPKLKLFEPGAILLDCLYTRTVPGHTPGHTTVTVRSAGKELNHIVDTAHTQLLFAHPEWGTEWDVDFELGIRSRKQVLSDLSVSKQLAYACHLPWPGLGHVRTKGDGYEWVPLPIATPG